jgi:uncharacterized protein (TIGR03435 family)
VADAFQKLSADDRRTTRQHMLQALLADRFKLAVHRDSKEFPVYSLVIAKTGAKLQETKPAADGTRTSATRGGSSIRSSSYGNGPVTITALHCSAADLAGTFAARLGRPVLDKTGLPYRYDFTLQFQQDDVMSAAAASNNPPSDVNAPSLFTAIQEQLGLKLESGKGPVEVIVIDHVERPSGN